jgi:hypothetical protein
VLFSCLPCLLPFFLVNIPLMYMAYARLRARMEDGIRKALDEASGRCGRVSQVLPHLGNRVIFELKTERPGARDHNSPHIAHNSQHIDHNSQHMDHNSQYMNFNS